MIRFFLALLFAVPLQAQAFFGLFVDDWTVPESRPTNVVVTLYITNATPHECWSMVPIFMQVLTIAAIAPIIGCAVYPLDGFPVCTVYITPMGGDLDLGHEIRHCFDRDYHGLFGV